MEEEEVAKRFRKMSMLHTAASQNTSFESGSWPLLQQASQFLAVLYVLCSLHIMVQRLPQSHWLSDCLPQYATPTTATLTAATEAALLMLLRAN